MVTRWRNYLTAVASVVLFVAACNTPGSGGDSEPDPVAAPAASITFSPASGTTAAPVTAHFDSAGSTGDITEYLWYVDDRPLGQEPTFQHHFAVAGTHMVKLQVSDAHGRSDTAEVEFVALAPEEEGEGSDPEPPLQPEASLRFSPASGTVSAPASVTFDASASAGTISTYVWFVDDTEVGAGELLAHTFTEEGTYTVRLVVTGPAGDEDSAQAEYVVLSPDDGGEPGEPGEPEPGDPGEPGEPEPPTPPIAIIGVSPTSGTATAPASLELDASGSTGEITSYQWTVDGAVISTSQTASHTFPVAGTFPIGLVVTDANGLQNDAQLDYTVLPAQHPGASHTLAPEQFGAYEVSIQPAGAWQASSSAPWLRVSPNTGAAGPATLTLTVDAATLPGSGNSFQAELRIVDPVGVRTGQVTVHLPQLSGPGSIQRADLPADSSHTVPFMLRNQGAAPLAVALTLQGSGSIPVSLSPSSGTIDSGGSSQLQLTVVCPAATAYYTGTLTVTTNDPRSPVSSISVQLRCTAPLPTGDYDIVLVFEPGAFTPQQQATIRAAADRWEQIVVGDIPDAGRFFPEFQEGCLRTISWTDTIAPEIDAHRNVDDLLVGVQLMEEEGNVLARGGPCLFIGELPNYGRVMINRNHLDYMTETESLETVAIHEMGHVLGIGTFWREQHRGLVTPSRQHCDDIGLDAELPRTFTGPMSLTEYHQLGGSGATHLDPPCFHWHQAHLQGEVLSSSIRINPGGNNYQPISRVTVGALEDLGYIVNYDAADHYELTGIGLMQELHEEGELFMYADPLIDAPGF